MSTTAGPWRQIFCVWGRNKRMQEEPLLWLRVPFRLMVQEGRKKRSCFLVALHPMPPLFSYSKTSSFISTLSWCFRHLHGTLSSLPLGMPPLVLIPFLTVRTLMGVSLLPSSMTVSQLQQNRWEYPVTEITCIQLPPLCTGLRARLGSECMEVLGRMVVWLACFCCVKY